MTENKYEIKKSSRFKKDYKRIKKRGYDLKLLATAINILARGETLPEEYNDHALIGDMSGFRECHIAPDWLLIYKMNDSILVLTLTRTGTHSDLLE